MTNEETAKYIGLLAKAEADGSYLALRSHLKMLTLDEIRTILNIVNALTEELTEYERKAS